LSAQYLPIQSILFIEYLPPITIISDYNLSIADIMSDNKAYEVNEKHGPPSTHVHGKGEGLYHVDTQTSETHGQVHNADQLQRHLGNRQVQLIAIGGSIGTAVFVSISNGLVKGGPGSLFLAYMVYTCMLGLVNNSMAEMSSYMPVTGGFIRMAGHWVDPAM
jgi:amino acid transporter